MTHLTRRQVLLGASAGLAAGAMGAVGGGGRRAAAAEQANAGGVERPLRLAVIGVANRGAANLAGVSTQEIVALCDVDTRYLNEAGQRHPGAKLYQDYRQLFEEAEGLDGVVISTPDHHHAPPAMMALQRGLHVYCEKPLAHTVAEVRALTDLARESGLATQLGTQIHAGSNYRRVVEVVRSGAIGPVRRVHVWVGKGWGATEMPQPAGEAPETLDWNVWLGPAEQRSYTPRLHPAEWRRYRDFGAGTLGDMGCHFMDLPYWALGLRYPATVRAEGPEADPECCPLGLSVRYGFAATDSHPELEMIWYDGDSSPKELEGIPVPGAGVLFVGDDGMLFADYGSHRLFPQEKFRDYQPPEPSIAESPGHYEEWIQACRGGEKALCHFEYSGPLTETVLLGVLAHRVGRPLEWNGEAMRCEGDDEATELLSKQYREGWSI